MKKTLQILLILVSINTYAQTNVTAVSTSYSAKAGFTYNANGAANAQSPIPGTGYTYNYGAASGTSNNKQTLNSFVAGGVIYSALAGVTQNVYLRRNGISPNNNIIYYDGTLTGTQLNLDRDYEENMETVFNGYGNFNAGTDNLFTNQGDGNGNDNNIEKVDVIFPTGVAIVDAAKNGIALFERGLTNQHDKFIIAVITSLNGANNAAASYTSNIITQSTGSYGTTDLITMGNQKYQIMRKQIGSPNNLQFTKTVDQNMGGIFFKFSDFGIANGTIIYGYTILPGDATVANGTDVLNYGGSIAYKTNTDNNAGGIDLVAITGIAEETGTAALHNIYLNVVKQSNGANLYWQMDDVDFGLNFEIEKSIDGITFNKIANKQSDFNTTYNFIDASAITAAKTFYRIKAISSEGKIVISNQVYLKNSAVEKIDLLSSNPMQGNEISLSIKSSLKDNATIRIIGLDSKIIATKKINLNAGYNFAQIHLPNSSTLNSFYVQVVCDDISFNKFIIR